MSEGNVWEENKNMVTMIMLLFFCVVQANCVYRFFVYICLK